MSYIGKKGVAAFYSCCCIFQLNYSPAFDVACHIHIRGTSKKFKVTDSTTLSPGRRGIGGSHIFKVCVFMLPYSTVLVNVKVRLYCYRYPLSQVREVGHLSLFLPELIFLH